MKHRDVYLDAADFLGERRAEMVHHAWLERRLEVLLKELAQEPNKSAWDADLEQAVGLEIFLKRHVQAADPIDRLCANFGDDEARRIDALSLCGRQRWHVKDFDAAIAALRQACELAFGRSALRLAQALNYLARLAIDTDRNLGQSIAGFIAAAREAAAQVPDRPDLELLIERSELIYLRYSRQFGRYGAKLAEWQKREKWILDNGFQSIYDAIRVEEAIALRSLGTERARCKAAALYDSMIYGGRDDSHPAMCCYLKADLFLDRAWSVVLDCLKFEKYLAQASDWVSRALERLDPQRDKAAYEKAETRRHFLEYRALADTRDVSVAVRDYAVREQMIKMLMLTGLGCGLLGSESPAGVDTTFVERLLQAVVANRIVERRPPPSVPVLSDYLNDANLLCIPRVVNNCLVIRLFALDPATRGIQNAGCFLLQDYNTADSSYGDASAVAGGDGGLRHSFDRILSGSIDRPDPLPFVGSLHRDNLLTVIPLEPLTIRDHLVIIAPPDNVDFVCPIESISASTDGRTRLMDLARKSIVYVDGYLRPSATMSARCQDPLILVADQHLEPGNFSLVQRVKEKLPGRTVVSFDLASPPSKIENTASLILIGHDDSSGRLRESIRRIDVSGLESIVLLVCGSARYEEVRGPFAAGLALHIRHRLGEAAALAATRIPISLRNGLPLVVEILNDGGSSPLGQIIHSHMRRQVSANPFRAPWVLL
jgi:hypothetical protein